MADIFCHYILLESLHDKVTRHKTEIGKIRQCILAKLGIADCGKQAKLACEAVQLCAGVKAGIEGIFHSVYH